MLKAAGDELVCDMAETYHIYDMRSVPLRTLAILANGLGPNSRVWAKLNGYTGKWSDIVLAMCADHLATLVWFQTEDGHKGRNRPEYLVPAMLGIMDRGEKKKFMTFATGEDFDRMWASL